MSAGRVVVITGGAKGVGAGITRQFLAAGDTVIVCGRSAPETLPEGAGTRPQFIALDVRDGEATATMLANVKAQYGRLDVLVNNAGGSPFAMADTASPRFHEAIIRLNLLAPLELARQANATMQAQDTGGVILFIGSVSALRPSPGTAAYGAAKAGILNLVRTLAVEWAPKVRVAAVSPGLIRTEQSHLHYGDEGGIAAAAATIPAQRLGTPEDVGNACVYLASDNASYASGSNLVLEGGGERPAFLDKATVNQPD